MSDYDDAAVELLLDGAMTDDPACAVIEDLRELGRAAPPAPSALLAALLAGGCRPVAELVDEPVEPAADRARRTDRTDAVLAALPVGEVARRNHVGRLVAAGVLVGGATLGLTGVAAAHDALPDPAQSVVRSVVNTVTTFHIDPPPRRHEISHSSPAGKVLPTADRFDGAAALPQQQADPVPSAAVAPKSRHPAVQDQGDARSLGKQRSARAAALHAKRVAARVAAQRRAEQRAHRHVRRHVEPGTSQPPAVLPGFGFAGTPVVARQPIRDVRPITLRSALGPAIRVPGARQQVQDRVQVRKKERTRKLQRKAHRLRTGGAPRRQHQPTDPARVVPSHDTSQSGGLSSET